jgi:DNA invertase Pin-like site-specific DNA recombinase
MFHIIGAMAEFERELIRERVKQVWIMPDGKGRGLGENQFRRSIEIG